MFYKSNKNKTLCSNFHIQALISICCIGMSRAVVPMEEIPHERVRTRHFVNNPNSWFSWFTCARRRVDRLNAIESQRYQEEQIKALRAEVRGLKPTLQNGLEPSVQSMEKRLVEMMRKIMPQDHSSYDTPVSFEHIPEYPADIAYKLECNGVATKMAGYMTGMIGSGNVFGMVALLINAFSDIQSMQVNPHEAEFRKNLEQRRYEILLAPLKNQLRQYLLNAKAYQQEFYKPTMTGDQKALIQEKRLSILQLIANSFKHAHDTLPQEASKHKIDDNQVQNLQKYLMSLANKMEKIAIIQEIILILPAMLIDYLKSSNPNIMLDWQTLSEALDDILYMDLEKQLARMAEILYHYDSICKNNASTGQLDASTGQLDASTGQSDAITGQSDAIKIQVSTAKKVAGQLSDAQNLIVFIQLMQANINEFLCQYDERFIDRVNQTHYKLSNNFITNVIVDREECPQEKELKGFSISVMDLISQEYEPKNIDNLMKLLKDKQKTLDQLPKRL